MTNPGDASNEKRFLVYGRNGWIGGMLINMLKAKGCVVKGAESRLENRESVEKEILEFKPTHVLNCAGVTGRPNVDWCEDNKQATIRSNVIGTLGLADVCWLHKVHMTNFATGCIYVYDNGPHKLGSGVGFTETDPANFDGSYYSKTKAMTEKLLQEYENVLTLRLRMPVSDDLHPRNFVTKITKYEYVVDIPNSNSLLYDLLPASLLMAEKNVTGVYNFTNPGAISHNEVLALFKKYIKPEFTWKNFSLEEQAKVIKAGRSNCELDTSKLEKKLSEYGVKIPEVHIAYENCFKRMAENLKK
jgi:dTDP-4-dehydrorhamnose reductase